MRARFACPKNFEPSLFCLSVRGFVTLPELLFWRRYSRRYDELFGVSTGELKTLNNKVASIAGHCTSRCGNLILNGLILSWLNQSATLYNYGYLNQSATLYNYAYLNQSATLYNYAYLNQSLTLYNYAYLNQSATLYNYAYLNQSATLYNYHTIYINIVLVSKWQSVCGTSGNTQHSIGVYSEGSLLGCGLHGSSLASVLF